MEIQFYFICIALLTVEIDRAVRAVRAVRGDGGDGKTTCDDMRKKLDSEGNLLLIWVTTESVMSLL